jgi:methionine biosynthesis protein MetW
MSSPDQNSTGFLLTYPDPIRYENQSRDPGDVGMKLASLIAGNSRVLDVGCGTGSITELIGQETQARIVGIEPDAARAAIARSRGLEVFEGLLSENFLKEHEPFDTIVFADVLEHLPNPGALVLIAKKGLVPGGSIVASVPNIAHWFVRLDLLRGRFDYRDCGIMDATHLRWFTRDTLDRFFDILGFKITQHFYTVNTGMIEYRQSWPWAWLPLRARMSLVRLLVNRFPTLFGCQHVVRATPK